MLHVHLQKKLLTINVITQHICRALGSKMFGRSKGPQIIKVILCIVHNTAHQAPSQYISINDTDISRQIIKFDPLSYHQAKI